MHQLCIWQWYFVMKCVCILLVLFYETSSVDVYFISNLFVSFSHFRCDVGMWYLNESVSSQSQNVARNYNFL